MNIPALMVLALITAVSPDGRNEIGVSIDPLTYEVRRDGVTLVEKTEIGLKIDGVNIAKGVGAKSVVSNALAGEEKMPFYKKDSISLAANEKMLDFGDWALRLIARNDGVAYRFETKMPNDICVNSEVASLTLPEATERCWAHFTAQYGCEETKMQSLRMSELTTKKSDMIYLPFVYSIGGKMVAVTDSDVEDYPIWNLKRENGERTLRAKFAQFPKKTEHVANPNGWDSEVILEKGGRWVKVRKLENFLTKTEGTRTFPWRVFVIADEPSKLVEADIVHALARPAVGDFSWVKPGKVAWDWWNCWDNLGNEGCTTETYRRFFDFAATNGIEYVIFDEGWSKQLDIWTLNEKVDLKSLIDYGNQRGVGTILWLAWAQAYGDEERVASEFAKLGIKGFKVDFMDRGDAEVERFLWKFAEVCAAHHLIIDYHGVHRPTGLSRTYPNVLNYEGVHGLEQMKWNKGDREFIENEVRLVFGRLSAGPMDFTPGAMKNYAIGNYPAEGTYENPGSIGTRARQMAEIALFEAPLQMLADSPTHYEQNRGCLGFMVQIPTVWADTLGLGGTPDTFAAVARKTKEGSWYAMGINNLDEREFLLNTSFLGEGVWKAEIFSDHEDDYEKCVRKVKRVKAGSELKFNMSAGGGFIVKFTR